MSINSDEMRAWKDPYARTGGEAAETEHPAGSIQPRPDVRPDEGEAVLAGVTGSEGTNRWCPFVVSSVW